ncbi:unnamed protein product [Nippostrongylus brasiliensis]|uniref:LanC-like protein 3 (inferred by orthology to a human protein) n=1 Tax=Nippostrongylus brasiliensis TaxID=27835 RepID=A0A0N4YQW0_NIPBR|nr:unnamed protein product [Nippostrongylus brasiliensis]
MWNPELREELVLKIEKTADVLAADDYPSDEILVGRAGFLSGVLWIRQAYGSNLVSDSCVQKVLSAMISSGKRYSSRHKSPSALMYDYHGTEYLGAAHGLAGILQTALGERGDDQLVHWCHGAAGVILLCLTLWKRYGDQKYFKAALRCGELIWNKGVLKKGPGICHGVGGNGA